MNKRRLSALTAAALLVGLLTGCGSYPAEAPLQPDSEIREYTASDAVLYNPLMGFAPEADYEEAVGEHTLVYLEVLWKEIEPEEGAYDFTSLEERNLLSRWREEGKHVVLRFICDKPSEEVHMDIPQWLYDKTGDGTFYAYDETHQGYSPDYNNPVFIEAHRKVIAALGEHFGRDTFVSYVELGSLGHWGEWHVNYDSGIVRLPKEAVREQYVLPYLEAFPQAKILMRRPFNTAKTYGFGLYDDTAGNPEATADWLDWIQNGGDYSQAEEEDALSPMPDAWKTAPIGGEFNSDLTLTEMLSTGLNTTISLLTQSHTTFLGPKIPHGLDEENGAGCEEGIEAVLKTLGYRLRVEQASYMAPQPDREGSLTLTWTNDGVAPMYWDWPVYLYFLDGEQQLLGKYPVELETTGLLPEEKRETVTSLSLNPLTEKAAYLCVGIEDPLTEKPAVSLAMNTEEIDRMAVLYHWE